MVQPFQLSSFFESPPQALAICVLLIYANNMLLPLTLLAALYVEKKLAVKFVQGDVVRRSFLPQMAAERQKCIVQFNAASSLPLNVKKRITLQCGPAMTDDLKAMMHLNSIAYCRLPDTILPLEKYRRSQPRHCWMNGKQLQWFE